MPPLLVNHCPGTPCAARAVTICTSLTNDAKGGSAERASPATINAMAVQGCAMRQPLHLTDLHRVKATMNVARGKKRQRLGERVIQQMKQPAE